MANSLIKSMLMTLTNVPEYEDSPRKEKELGCIAECNVGISNNWFHDRTTLRLYPDCVHIIRTRHNTNAEVPSDQVIMLSDIDHIEVTTITKARVIRFGNEVSKDRPYPGQYYPNEVVFDEKYLQNVNEFVSAVRERIKKKSATKGFDTIINTGTINIFNYTETVNIIDIYQQIENEGGADKAELKSLLVDIQRMLKMMEEERRIPQDPSMKTRIGKLIEKHPAIATEILKYVIQFILKIIPGV